MFGIPIQAAGPITAALIAGALAFLGLLVSKEQKTSEFRQAWIDALRGEVAEVIARVVSIYNSETVPSGNGSTGSDEDYRAATLAVSKIRLRLNPKESESQAILTTLDEIETAFNDDNMPNRDDVTALVKKLLAQAQIVLKIEWNRVRRGEPIFVASKFLAAFAILGALAALIILSNSDVSSPETAGASVEKNNLSN